MRGRCAFVAILLSASPAMALDLAPLWDFSQPAVSEARFRAALETARGDDALILRTQIARSHGLRKDFATARDELAAIADAVASAGPEARARHALEVGRTYVSAAHAPDALTPDAKALARASYERATTIATDAHLDALAVDAIHMRAFVDPAPADQWHWGRAALAVVEASSQPDAKRWEASIRNNLGYALHQLGRYDEALAEFERAVVLRERGTNAEATRTAHWMVAWTQRALGRTDEALATQLRLERECDAAGAPDRYVYEELEILYRLRGDTESADRYAALAVG